jgi:hypothetical protein
MQQGPPEKWLKLNCLCTAWRDSVVADFNLPVRTGQPVLASGFELLN